MAVQFVNAQILTAVCFASHMSLDADPEDGTTSPTPSHHSPVAWMHPTAGWTFKQYDSVACSCAKRGPLPIPLYPATSQKHVQGRIAELEKEVKDLRHDLASAKGKAKNATSNLEYWRAQNQALADAPEKQSLP